MIIQMPEFDIFGTVEKTLGAEQLKYLQNKLRGGKSNSNGGRYESNFAVYKLSQCIKSILDGVTTKLEVASQEPNFVDDFVVWDADNSSKESFQLKNSANVAWNSGTHPIATDFDYHYQIDRACGVERSVTTLTISNETLYEELSQTIPKEISHHTNCILFEDYTSVNTALIEGHAVREALSDICLYNEIDKLEHLHVVIKGVWEDNKSDIRDVDKFIEKVRAVKPEFLHSFASTDVLDSAASNILNNIDGFSYIILDKRLQYEYSSDSGGMFSGFKDMDADSDWEEFCAKVVEVNPQSFRELLLGVL